MIRLKRPIGRLTRSKLLLWLLVGSLGFALLDWFAFSRINLMLNPGFQLDAIRSFHDVLVWRVVLEVLYNAVLTVAAIARLRDVSRSGWWLLGLIMLPVAVAAGASPVVGLVVLAGWLALLFMPGTIGPNRYWPDPRGWKSREHFDAQARALAQPPQAKP